MARCQHCNKLTHAEHLYVWYKIEDFEKVQELTNLTAWIPESVYNRNQLGKCTPGEFGKLKCGDIYIHFVKLP